MQRNVQTKIFFHSSLVSVEVLKHRLGPPPVSVRRGQLPALGHDSVGVLQRSLIPGLGDEVLA